MKSIEARTKAAQREAKLALDLAKGEPHERVHISLKAFCGLRKVFTDRTGAKKVSVTVLRRMYEDSLVRDVTRLIIGE